MMIHFLYPALLLLLFLVPVFVLIYILAILYNKKKAISFPNFEALERIGGVEFFSRNYVGLYISVIIIFLLVFAVSGMSVSYNVDSSSFSYVIAVDNSVSMKVSDLQPNRMEAAKSSAKNFVDSLPSGSEVGVIAFSGDAKILQQLDNSKIKTKMAIDSINFGDVQGTNILNALIAAKDIFKDKRLKSIIILSDGQINVGETPKVIRYANDYGIVINSFAIGTSAGGLTEFDTVSKVDEDILKSYAFNTNGKFFLVKDGSSLEDSFKELLDETNKEVSFDLSMYLILGAIFLFLIYWTVSNFRFKVLP